VRRRRRGCHHRRMPTARCSGAVTRWRHEPGRTMLQHRRDHGLLPAHEPGGVDRSDARRAVVQPGLVLDALRDRAEEHGLTFGPDPSTHNRCTLGGMIGNNSCGGTRSWPDARSTTSRNSTSSRRTVCDCGSGRPATRSWLHKRLAVTTAGPNTSFSSSVTSPTATSSRRPSPGTFRSRSAATPCWTATAAHRVGRRYRRTPGNRRPSS